MNLLYHLFSAPGFEFESRPSSLQTEGFVHLSSAEQLLGTAERWFAEHQQVKILVLDPNGLTHPLRWEDSYGRGEPYPHLYGPLEPQAVVAIMVMQRGPDGRYQWPVALAGGSPLGEPPDEGIALIEPSRRFPDTRLGARCLLCCLDEVLELLTEDQGWEILTGLGSAIGASRVFRRGEVVVCHPGVGGPVAAATVEELIALGCREFLFCGGAGTLVAEPLGRLVLVERALRDEGVSHHYFPAARSEEVDVEWLAQIERALIDRKVEYRRGVSWTTDALYRETPARIERRRQAGCLTVEMELASVLAVTRFRGARLAALLYCGDDLSTEEWDFRAWTAADSVRESLFRLCLDVLESDDLIAPCTVSQD